MGDTGPGSTQTPHRCQGLVVNQDLDQHSNSQDDPRDSQQETTAWVIWLPWVCAHQLPFPSCTPP
jgi:hypothetical protein